MVLLKEIEKGIKALSRYECDIIPTALTIARTAWKLEKFVEEKHSLEVMETKTVHGPVFFFDEYLFLRVICNGFGLVEHTRTRSVSKPIMHAGNWAMHNWHVDLAICLV
jgi:hypothetical protein